MGKTLVLYKLCVSAQSASIVFKQTQGLRQTESLGIWDTHLPLNKQNVTQ